MSYITTALTVPALFGGAGSGTPAGAEDGLFTELSEQLLTEAGDFLIWEA